jgi:hypothetical protein
MSRQELAFFLQQSLQRASCFPIPAIIAAILGLIDEAVAASAQQVRVSERIPRKEVIVEFCDLFPTAGTNQPNAAVLTSEGCDALAASREMMWPINQPEIKLSAKNGQSNRAILANRCDQSLLAKCALDGAYRDFFAFFDQAVLAKAADLLPRFIA